MPDIGDIHSVGNAIRSCPQRSNQEILKEVGSHIADMRIVVDRWSTTINRNLAWYPWSKPLEGPGHGIEELQALGKLGKDKALGLGARLAAPMVALGVRSVRVGCVI
jgi:hypothetical protein